MQQLTLHHYGFLTSSTEAWLKENELLFGKPFKTYDTVSIQSQKVDITFIQQTEGAVLTELIMPWEQNVRLQKWLAKGITIYHTGYLAAKGNFDNILRSFEEKKFHALPQFYSEAFENKRCVFIITGNLGMIELIETGS